MSKIERELDNFFKTVADLSSRAEEWSSRPSWLEFASNNICNLRCVMCAQADGLPVIAMRRTDARELLADILPHTTIWTPSALSEPLLADFRVVLEQCRKHEVWLNMYTNATLTTPEKFREMSDRLHKLYISFDSHIPEVFETLRTPAKFEEVLENVRGILPIAVELQIPIAFVVVLMPETLATLPEFMDFVADIGGTEARVEVRAQPMLDNAEGCATRHLHDAYTTEEICALLDRAGERAEARKVLLAVTGPAPYAREIAPVAPFVRGVTADVVGHMMEHIKREHPHFCYMSSMYLKIEPDGRVFPCCVAPEELTMGNINESSVEEIWNGPAYRELRRRMHARDYPAACLACDHLTANPRFEMPEAVAPPGQVASVDAATT